MISPQNGDNIRAILRVQAGVGVVSDCFSKQNVYNYNTYFS